MDLEKLIDELDAIASTDVFVGSPTFGRVRLNREVARTVLRAAFAEVRLYARLEALREAQGTVMGCIDQPLAMDLLRESISLAEALLLPAAEEGGLCANCKQPYGLCVGDRHGGCCSKCSHRTPTAAQRGAEAKS